MSVLLNEFMHDRQVKPVLCNYAILLIGFCKRSNSPFHFQVLLGDLGNLFQGSSIVFAKLVTNAFSSHQGTPCRDANGPHAGVITPWGLPWVCMCAPPMQAWPGSFLLWATQVPAPGQAAECRPPRGEGEQATH